MSCSLFIIIKMLVPMPLFQVYFYMFLNVDEKHLERALKELEVVEEEFVGVRSNNIHCAHDTVLIAISS